MMCLRQKKKQNLSTKLVHKGSEVGSNESLLFIKESHTRCRELVFEPELLQVPLQNPWAQCSMELKALCFGCKMETLLAATPTPFQRCASNTACPGFSLLLACPTNIKKQAFRCCVSCITRTIGTIGVLHLWHGVKYLEHIFHGWTLKAVSNSMHPPCTVYESFASPISFGDFGISPGLSCRHVGHLAPKTNHLVTK